MINWDALISEQLFVEVLPGSYRRYTLPLRDGLVWFLRHLPTPYQQQVFADQVALSVTTPAAQRLAALARSCPSLHKLGQTLARDHRLSPSFRRHLQKLESLPPSTPRPMIETILRRELGPLDRRHITLGATLAEGSVAVVVACHQSGHPEGVLKLLKPHIKERLDRELAVLADLGAFLDEDCERLGIPPLDYEESLRQVREKLRMEVRLDLEQRHLRQATAMYADNSAVQIPALFENCTPRITAMERIYGKKLTQHRFSSSLARRHAAELAASVLIAKPLFSQGTNAVFHADPHGGNLLFTRDGRLAILDWSLVASLTESHRAAIVQIAAGAMLQQPSRVAAAVASFADRGLVHHHAIHTIARSWVNKLGNGALPGIAWLIGLFDETIHTTRLRVPADLMLFRRAYHALEGVLADLHAGSAAADAALAREFAAALMSEWPARWITPAFSRNLPTRLSNFDLGELMLTLPWIAPRYAV